MSCSTDSTKDNMTTANDQRGSTADDDDVDDVGSLDDFCEVSSADQLKEFRAKMEMELKDIKQLHMIKELKLENAVLQAEMREQKLSAEHSALQAKVSKMEQKQKEDASVADDQLKAILDRIGQLEVKQKQNDNVYDQLKAIRDRIIGQVDEKPKQKEIPKKADYRSVEVLSNAKFVVVGDNCWDANACAGDLQITGPKCLTVQKGGGRQLYGYVVTSYVFAKCSIPRSDNSSGIFYFEVKVERMKKCVGIGIATKALPLRGSTVGSYSDSYGYSSDGRFWISGSVKEGKAPPFFVGHVVGCGVNLATGKLIFTHNGQLLDTTDLSISSPFDALFPCISLYDVDDKIEANFGPHFKLTIGNV